MNKIKIILMALLIFLPCGCISSIANKIKKPSPPPNNRSFTQIKNVDIKDIDTNKDNVIDKDELKAFQDNNTPDSTSPLYVIILISLFTFVMCILPKSCSLIKKKLKK